MSALTPTSIKVETEGDLQVLNLYFATVRTGDTYDGSGFFKNVVQLQATANTAVGASQSAGVVTFTSTSGSPSVFLRLAGN